MAITQTGSFTTLSGNGLYNGASGTISAITVPADAEIMLIGVSAFSTTAGRISANGCFNIGAATSVGVGGAGSTSAWQAALHYILAPPVGTQNLEWQWGGGAGAALTDGIVVLGYLFLKGIDTASPIRDSDGSNGPGDSESTPTLTAQPGDWIVAYAGIFTSPGVDQTIAWSGGGGATSLAQGANFSHADGGFGKAEPTGNQVMTATATGSSEGGVGAFVIKPAAEAGGGALAWLPGVHIVGGRTRRALASGFLPPDRPS
jgi:hypothetical protein